MDRHRRHRQPTRGLVQAVVPPVGIDHRCGDGATSLLEEKWHTVGESQDMDGLIPARHQVFARRTRVRLPQVHVGVLAKNYIGLIRPPKGNGHFDLKRIAAVRGGRSRGCGQKIRIKLLPEPL